VHQLKILLKTSIPEQGELIELTSSLLPIKVKSQLGKYPYFSPSLEYPRTVIQDMRYEDRINFFFNQGTFNKFMKKYNKKLKKEKDLGKNSMGNQSMDKEEGEQEIKKENVEKNVNEIYGSDLCIANFLFTIQTILPTGYTADNHYQSIEFYDPSVRDKLFTLKGSRPGWISSLLVPRRYKRNFSHINYKGTPYTVDKVTWVNDAINHPDYNPIIESYAEGENDKEKQDKEMSAKKKELGSKIEMEYKLFVLKMLLKIDKYKVYTKDTRDREGSEYTIRDRIENAMYKIVLKEKEKEKEKEVHDDFKFNFDGLIEKLDINFNNSKFGKLYKGVREDEKPYWLGSTLLKNEDKITKNKTYKNYFTDFYKFFSSDSKSRFSTIKKRIEEHLYPFFDAYNKFTKAKSILYSNRTAPLPNSKDIMIFAENVAINTMRITAINYKQSGQDYKGDMDAKEIESYLKSEFKEYLSKSQYITALYNKYYITNQYWKQEVESHINESSGKFNLEEDDENNNNNREHCQFEMDMKRCYDSNSLCKKKGIYQESSKYLKIGLDRLKSSTTNVAILEAILYVDVMKGKLTNQNYKSINCTYSNNKLGYHIDELNESTTENNIDDLFYIDVTKDLEKWEIKNKTSKSKSKGKSKDAKKTRKKRQ
jgi:hypothetical protein